MLAALTLVAGLLAGQSGAASCEPPIAVRGHEVPAHVVDEIAADAPALFAHAADVVDLATCPALTVDIDVVAAIEGARVLDPPWHLPPWAAGAAVTQRAGASSVESADPAHHTRIVVAVTAQGRRQDRVRVLLHELAHVATAAKSDSRAPRWLDEGIARVVANEDSTTDLTALATARLGNRLLPLSALEATFPGRSDLAQLAYAESARAVAVILDRGGPGAVGRVLAYLASGNDLDDALLSATGRRAWQLDVDVERSIPMWRAAAVLGLETDLAFAACAAVVAWAGWRARRRIRDRIAAMPDDDAVPGTPLLARLLSRDSVVLRRWTVSP
jgi:hypothetical protein